MIGLRIGETMDLRFHWFHKCEPIGTVTILTLSDGDAYAMSDVTVGWNWRVSKIPTLRHSAGAAKYTALPRKRKRVDAS